MANSIAAVMLPVALVLKQLLHRAGSRIKATSFAQVVKKNNTAATFPRSPVSFQYNL